MDIGHIAAALLTAIPATIIGWLACIPIAVVLHHGQERDAPTLDWIIPLYIGAVTGLLLA